MIAQKVMHSIHCKKGRNGWVLVKLIWKKPMIGLLAFFGECSRKHRFL